MNYESILERESETTPGVTFVLAKMSFGRRVELTRRLREIAQRVEFLEAGPLRDVKKYHRRAVNESSGGDRSG